ncbi:hypothetical protein, partial [uncultured Helicobacter sp.]|uniref:beta strand repeat-containing protein n=1 Tax=uncultured Helicobacter sp. TaxID=175537 RepID=UPI00261B25C4
MSNSKKSFVSLSLISSVLATILNAQNITNGDNQITIKETNAPTITVETTETKVDSHFSWSNPLVPNGSSGSNLTGSITWSDNNNELTATTKLNGGSSTNVNEFHLYFNTKAATQILIQNSGSGSGNKVVVKGGASATAITADFRGKSLCIPSATDTKGTLFLNFGQSGSTTSNESVKARTLTVKNLNHLEGNLTVIDGENRKNTYSADLQSMTGNLQFYGDTLASSSGTITFNGTGLIGNIASVLPIHRISKSSYQEGDGVTINFNDSSTMTGDIKGYGTGNDSLKKNITFQGNGDVLTGNVISYGSATGSVQEVGSHATGGHHITFEKGNMIGSIISTQGNGQSITGFVAGSTQRRGYNSITFSGSSQTLTGGILAVAYNNINSGSTPDNFNAKNVLNLGQNTTLSIVSQTNGTVPVEDKDSAIENVSNTNTNKGSTFTNKGSTIGKQNVTFNVETGSITASGYGTNEINLGSGSTLILNNGEGFIKTAISGKNPFDDTNANRNTGGTDQAKSIINFNGTGGTLRGNINTQNGIATIAFKDSNGVINGNFYTSGGVAEIDVYAGANATITGDITTDTAPLPPRRGADTATRTGNGSNNIILGFTSPTPLAEANSALPPRVSTLTLQGNTNTINNLTASAEKSTLIIDGSLNANTTTITTITDGNNLTLNLNGRGTEKGAVAT